MIGSVLKAQSRPQLAPKVTTKLRDALLAGWTERSDRAENHSEREYDGPWFRSSSLGKICSRSEYLVDLVMKAQAAAGPDAEATPVEGESHGAETLWIFGIGTAYHEMLQGAALPSLGVVFQGWWRCRSCNRLHVGDENVGQVYPHGRRIPPALSYGWIPRPKVCGMVCDGKSFHYQELQFIDRELRLSGHCDGVLVWEDDPTEPEIFEGKTANEFRFAAMHPETDGKPDASNVLQGASYMMMSGLTKCRMVYINKSGKKLADSMVEHLIELDPAVVYEIRSGLAVPMAAIRDGKQPDRVPECKTVKSARAKRCPVASLCFRAKA